MSSISPDEHNRKILQHMLKNWCLDLQFHTRKDGIVLSRESLQLIDRAESAVEFWKEKNDDKEGDWDIGMELPESTVRLYLIGTAVRDDILPNLSTQYLKLKEVKKRTRRGRGGSWKIKIPVVDEKNVERRLKSAFKTKIKHKKDEKLVNKLKQSLQDANDQDDDECTHVRELLAAWRSIVISPSSPLQDILKPLLRLADTIETIEEQLREIDATTKFYAMEMQRLQNEKQSLETRREHLQRILERHPLKQDMTELEKRISAMAETTEMQHFLKLVHHVVHVHLREIEYGRVKPTKFVKELQAWHDDDSLGFSDELAKHWSPLVEYMLMHAEEALRPMRWFQEEFTSSITDFQHHLTKSSMARQFLELQQMLARYKHSMEQFESLDHVKELHRLSEQLTRIEDDIEKIKEKMQALADKKTQLQQDLDQSSKKLRDAIPARR